MNNIDIWFELVTQREELGIREFAKVLDAIPSNFKATPRPHTIFCTGILEGGTDVIKEILSHSVPTGKRTHG